jgi:hypothetical protein
MAMHKADSMFRRALLLFLLSLSMSPPRLRAQAFELWGHEIQTHGFVSQGFIHTDGNNWLTMNTNHVGSGEFSDFGANESTQLTNKFRIGAQIYDRNLGQLGRWHPSLDWAVAGYRFTRWFGIRGGKVKTTLGLYNDTQDLDFLRTFALLPQSVYPTDIRDATIAHVGGDLYGSFSLHHGLGDLSYTAYAGHRSDGIYSGYAYLASQFGVHYSTYGGLQYGGDLRWNTPLKGLLIGASRLDQDVAGKGAFINPLNPGAGSVPYSDPSKKDWTNQFYGEYAIGKLRIDSEYRRFLHDQTVNGGILEIAEDIRGWYISGAYRVRRQLALGSYYSRYTITTGSTGPLALLFPDQTGTGLPANHIYDKVITARVDLNRFWNVKLEGHFMNGYGSSIYPDGFYPQVNPEGFKPNTKALVIKTSLNF